MAYEATGTLIVDMGIQQVSEKFRKREFVLEIQDGQYPQQVKFQLTQDKSDLLNNFTIGTDLTVTFDLRGRGYDKNGQMLYFTNLEAWKIAAAGGAPAGGGGGNYGQQQQQPAAAAPQPRPAANTNAGYQKPPASTQVADATDNDLPF